MAVSQPPLFEERPWAKDALHTNTTVQFGWRDRLNILLTGFFELRTTTYCQNAPGVTETAGAQTLTLSPLARWKEKHRRPVFYEAVREGEEVGSKDD